MKNKEFISLERKLLPQFPNMVVQGPMMLMTPVGQPVLRGLCFEGSSFDAKSFYVWMFWMPLYVPTKHVYFDHGDRILDRWDATNPQLLEDLVKAIRLRAIPFLCGLETLQDVLHRLRLAADNSKNPYDHQALAYTLVKVGETTEAISAIDVLLELLNPAVSWQIELGERTRLLKEKILMNVEEAQTMLARWQSDSIRAIGLENIISTD